VSSIAEAFEKRDLIASVCARGRAYGEPETGPDE
jgi:hypothetical protein